MKSKLVVVHVRLLELLSNVAVTVIPSPPENGPNTKGPATPTFVSSELLENSPSADTVHIPDSVGHPLNVTSGFT